MIKNSDKESFCEMIEEDVSSTKMTYIETILHHIETDKDLEVEDIPKLLTHQVKRKIQSEAQDLKLMDKLSAIIPDNFL